MKRKNANHAIKWLSISIVISISCCAGFAAQTGKKSILGYGWEFLAVGTEDVWRNRDKLAAVGYDGYLLPIDRQATDGSLVRARDLLAEKHRHEPDFDRRVAMLRECLALPGLSESLAFGSLITAKRLAWTDDAA